MHHSFDIKLAEIVGVKAAVIFNHFHFWINKNKIDKRNFFDGYYWTFSTANALTEHFPYLTVRQIRLAINKLIEKNILIIGNYNKEKYDQTRWYAINNDIVSKLQKCNRGSYKNVTSTSYKNVTSTSYKNVTPIPDNTTDNITDNIDIKKNNFKPPSLQEVDNYCKQRKNNIDAQGFINYYSSVGWIVGKNKKKMIDWKAAIRTWEINNKKSNKRDDLSAFR